MLMLINVDDDHARDQHNGFVDDDGVDEDLGAEDESAIDIDNNMMMLLLISDDHPGAGEPWHPADKSSSSSCRRKDKGRLETFFTL